MFENIFHHFQFLKIVLFWVFWALCGPLVVAIVLVAKNCVERSFSELWKMCISSFYENFHFSTALSGVKTALSGRKGGRFPYVVIGFSVFLCISIWHFLVCSLTRIAIENLNIKDTKTYPEPAYTENHDNCQNTMLV